MARKLLITAFLVLIITTGAVFIWRSRPKPAIETKFVQNVENRSVNLDAGNGNNEVTNENSEGGKNKVERQQTETIGFSGNKVSIPGLAKQNAEILKNIILKKIKENPIEDSQSGL